MIGTPALANPRRFTSKALNGRLALVLATLSIAALAAGCGGPRDGDIASTAQHATTPWFLSTRVMTGGGSMTSPNKTAQVSADATLYKSYTTTGTVPISATANPGYQINAVTVNGVVVASSGTDWSGTFEAGVTGTVTVSVSFTPIRYGFTAVAGAGGAVSANPPAYLYYGNQGSVTFQPISGWSVLTISVSGASAVTCNGGSCAGPWSANQYVKVTVTAVAPVTVTATFGGQPSARAGAGQVVAPGVLVTLDGSGTIATTIPVTSYGWAQTSGPGPIALTAVGSNASFLAPRVEGQYNFALTVQPGGSVANTNVIVTSDPVSTAYTQCQSCHGQVGIGSASDVFGKWSASTHAAEYVMCFSCHVGSNSGGHPGDVSLSTVDPSTFDWKYATRGYPAGSNFCAQCHATAAQIVSDFRASIHSSAAGGPGTCSGCHGDAHAARSTTTACVSCHGDATGNISGHPFAVGGSTVCTTCHNPHTTAAAPSGGHDVHVSAGIGCSVCHVQIIGVVNFDPAGAAWSPALPPPSFDPTAKTCTNVACHSVPAGEYRFTFQGGDGTTQDSVISYGGSTTTPSWYSTPQGGCTACHDLTYQGRKYVWHSGMHGGAMPGGNNCQLCHVDVTGTVTTAGPSADTALRTATTCGVSGTVPCASFHRNGSVDVAPAFASRCFGCH